MTYSHNESDENDTESGSDDEMSPSPTTDWGGDDDEPPAAGGVVVEIENNYGLEISMAPTAEPEHRVKPEAITA